MPRVHAAAVLLRLVLGLILAVALALPAAAREEIRAFRADIALRVDGSVEVTETIEVNAEGRDIRRGIFRDIPTVLINADGSRQRSSLRVVSVSRDGRDEPYAVESIANGSRIRIGDADMLLEQRLHRYVIRYTMTRMARRFADHDELYWNATGNYWDFPILSAVANVRLPDGSVISDLVGYTGPLGSTEQDLVIERTSDSTASFRASRALASGEGMTVVASFAKGALATPTGLQGALFWLSDHRDLILPVIAVGLALLYNLLAWDSVGRDPRKGTIIPLFYPPKGFSPALAHYVHEMGFKQNGWTAFTAALIDLGVKGLATISRSGKTTSLSVTGRPAESLPAGEQIVFDLLEDRQTLTIDTRTGRRLNEARSAFVRTIENENREVYFRNNTAYVLVGVALSIFLLGALIFFEVLEPFWLAVALVAGIVIALGTTLFQAMWKGPGLLRFIIPVWIAIAVTNVAGSIGNLLANLTVSAAAIAAASIVVITVVFAILLRAPTVQGRKVMDEIEGFRMYLETAEKERLNMTGVPEMTVSRFEAILPYAIALGVEKPWSEHFEAELSRNAVADAGGGYAPHWYRGPAGSFSAGSIGRDVAAIGTSMSAAMIASQPQASSSSGRSGGGGGFSGGGGGGGGGGGW